MNCRIKRWGLRLEQEGRTFITRFRTRKTAEQCPSGAYY